MMLPQWITLTLDLVGTFVFAVSGALVAVRKNLDLVGMVVLAVAAGLGGGITRDVILGATPPAAFNNEGYLLATAGAVVVGFFFHPQIARFRISILLLDALGLGFCAVTGTAKSLDAGLAFVPAVLLGVVSGSGGGVVRDILSSEIPLILRRDIYALAALLGAVLFTVMIQHGTNRALAASVGIGVTFVLRVLAIRFEWQAPHPVGQRRPPLAEGDTTAHAAVSAFQRFRMASRDWDTGTGGVDARDQ